MKEKLKFTIARIAITLLFLIVTMMQIIAFPGQFAYIRRTHGISLFVEIVLTILVGLWMLCAQFALYSIWKIIGHMQNSSFYSSASMIWINRVIYALRSAVVIPALLFLLLIPQADDPGFFVMITAVGLFIFTLTIFATLLRDQIEIKADL